MQRERTNTGQTTKQHTTFRCALLILIRKQGHESPHPAVAAVVQQAAADVVVAAAVAEGEGQACWRPCHWVPPALVAVAGEVARVEPDHWALELLPEFAAAGEAAIVAVSAAAVAGVADIGSPIPWPFEDPSVTIVAK